MTSLYWDEFEKREKETTDCIKNNKPIPVRRVAIYITEKCNFNCVYCNMKNKPNEMTQKIFLNIVNKYGKNAVLHITGGEPSTVSWLYDCIENSDTKFNLNTNAYLKPPMKNINRMKISFDTHIEKQFNRLVRKSNAFDNVVKHIKMATERSIVSLTCVLSKQTYLKTPYLAEYVNHTFPKLYALFFSLYKGNNPALKMTNEDINFFFEETLPRLKQKLSPESLELLNETLTHKFRLQDGIRFPENDLKKPCYLSMSERVIGPDGKEFMCSHLFRDKVFQTKSLKHSKCQYGCNTRLVKFNNDIQNNLNRL